MTEEIDESGDGEGRDCHVASQPRFHSDQPITTRSDDLLGRAEFSTHVAKALASLRCDESMVVALYGEWGSGKSSVKNMVRETLEDSPSGVSVVEFNPWEWADRSLLAQAFFEAVGIALGKDPDRGEGRAKKWREYAAYLGLASEAATQSRSVVGTVASLAVVLFGLSFVSTGWMHTVLAIAGVLFGALGVLLGASRSIATSVAEVLTVRAENRRKSLSDLKAEVKGMLSHLPAPLVVVIDDIDRLTPQEQQVVFQLVKANADFPNLAYLLSFDRTRVAHALSGMGLDGEAYLGKIVQVGFDLPLARSSDVHSVLTNGLESLLGAEVLRTKFDQAYWEEMFASCLGPYFANLRHVRRFLNTLQLQVSLLSGDGVLEVNPIDLVAIEVLRVFEPSLYNVLPGLRQDLAPDPSEMVFDRKARDGDLQKELERALDAVPAERRSRALELVCRLFPAAARAFGRGDGLATRNSLLAQSRVATHEYFDRYFLLRVPQGELTDATFDRILGRAADHDALLTELRGLEDGGLQRAFFVRLLATVDDVDAGCIQALVTGIFDAGDTIPRDRSPSFAASTDLLARITVGALLKRLPAEERPAVVQTCLAETTGLCLPVVWVARELLREGQQRSPDDYVLAAPEAEGLRSPALGLLRAAADNHALDSNPCLGMLLYAWRGLGDEAEVRAYVSEMIARADENAVVLLEATTGTVSTSSGLKFTLQLSNLELYADSAAIDAALARLAPDALEGDRGRAVAAYERAKQRREQGLADDPFGDDPS